MAIIRITDKGRTLITDADRQGGIYPNHIYLLSYIRDGKWHHSENLKQKLGLVDWDEVFSVLLKNKAIETAVGA